MLPQCLSVASKALLKNRKCCMQLITSHDKKDQGSKTKKRHQLGSGTEPAVPAWRTTSRCPRRPHCLRWTSRKCSSCYGPSLRPRPRPMAETMLRTTAKSKVLLRTAAKFEGGAMVTTRPSHCGGDTGPGKFLLNKWTPGRLPFLQDGRHPIGLHFSSQTVSHQYQHWQELPGTS